MLICLDLHVFMLYAMLSMLKSSISYVFYVRSTCFHVSYHVFVPRSIFPMCCLARSTCLYACLHIYLSRSTCFMLYAVLSMLRSIFPMCCLARSTCFYVFYMSICLSCMFHALFHVLLCFVPLFALC